MNVKGYIKSKLCPGTRMHSGSDTQDLFLYRQLRLSENRLHETRECLNSTLEVYNRAASACDHSERSAGDGSRHCLDDLRREIARLEDDAARCEVEYQLAQKNVRTYFYLETSPGRTQERGTAPGNAPH